MNQAVELTQASRGTPDVRERAKVAGAQTADVAQLFSSVFASVTHTPIKPQGMRDAVSSELHQSNAYELDDIAAAEMRSPSEEKIETLRDRQPRGTREQGSVRQSPAAPPRPPSSNTVAPQREVGTEQSGIQTQPESKTDSKQLNQSVFGRESARSTIAASQLAPVGLTRSGHQESISASKTGGSRSVSAVTSAAAGGKAMLSKLAQKPQAQMLRATKEQVPAQVSRALARVVTNGGGRLTLKLNPHALGEVRIDVEVTKGVARASLETQSAAARDLLVHDIEALRSALERRGVAVAHLDVSLASDSADSGRSNEGLGHQGHPAERGHDRSWRTTRNRNQSSVETEGQGSRNAEHEAGGLESVMPVRTDASGVVRIDALA